MNNKGKPTDIIKRYSSVLIDALVQKVKASGLLNHDTTKGELRELFVTNILKPFLTRQFEMGTGIIINNQGEQSRQTDIIIYDNRILPPFIKEQHIGVFPIESVIGTIEVKSWLSGEEIQNTEKAVEKLHENVFEEGIFRKRGMSRQNISQETELIDAKKLKPFCGIIGFIDKGVKKLECPEKGKQWLTEKVKYSSFLCLVGKFCWVGYNTNDKKDWVPNINDNEKNKNYNETKRFIAVFLDNLRTLAERRIQLLSQNHNDWLSRYIR